MIDCLEVCDAHAITLEHLKNHLRIEGAFEDYYLEGLIKTATSAVENYLQRTLLLKTLRVVHQDRTSASRGCSALQTIDLYYPPLVSIVSVNELLSNDGKGPIKRYTLTPSSLRPKMTVWGSVVEVVYKAGYGENSSNIPSPIRYAITLLTAEMYDKRVDVVEIVNPTIQFLLQPYRVMSCV